VSEQCFTSPLTQYRLYGNKLVSEFKYIGESFRKYSPMYGIAYIISSSYLEGLVQHDFFCLYINGLAFQ